MLEAGDPVEAVSAMEMALRLDMGFDTRKRIEKAKDEANIGSPERAEILLGLIDLKVTGELVKSSDDKSTGHTTGGTRECQMEGCRGQRLGVRWEDGKLTFPCTHGMVWNNNLKFWKIR